MNPTDGLGPDEEQLEFENPLDRSVLDVLVKVRKRAKMRNR